MKQKLNNPFARVTEGNQIKCFGCSQEVSSGLKLEFFDSGDFIEAQWLPHSHFEGYTNVLHGGIQATLLDEIAAWVVFTKCRTSGVTKKMNIDYLHPVYTHKGCISITGKLIERSERSALILSELFDSENELRAKAEVEYFIFPEAVAKRKHGYPGVEAFYIEKT